MTLAWALPAVAVPIVGAPGAPAGVTAFEAVDDGPVPTLLVADTVKFKGSDLKTAQDIQAGLAPTQQQVQANQADIQTNKAGVQANQQEIEANQQKIAANQAMIAAANLTPNRSAISAARRFSGSN